MKQFVQQTTFLGLILALLLAACSPLFPLKGQETQTPSIAASFTPDPSIQPPRTKTSILPTPAIASTAAPASVDNPKPILKTSTGDLVIEGARWVNEVNGVTAGTDEKILLILLGKPGQGTIEPGSFSLEAFDNALHDLNRGEVHISGSDGSYSICTMAGWVGKDRDAFAMGFRLPATGKALQLFWPGNEPIDLYPES